MSTRPRADDSAVMLVNITRDIGEDKGLVGINPEGEGVFVCKSVCSYILRSFIGNDPSKLVGKSILGQIMDNTRPEFPDQKYFCFSVHRDATQEEFHAEVAACEKDDFDKTEKDLLDRIKMKLKPLTDEEKLAKVREKNFAIQMS